MLYLIVLDALPSVGRRLAALSGVRPNLIATPKIESLGHTVRHRHALLLS